MSAGSLLFQGARDFGQGLQRRQESLKAERDRLKRAEATARFLESNSDILGVDPQVIQNLGSADLETTADLLLRAAPLRQQQAQAASRQQQMIGASELNALRSDLAVSGLPLDEQEAQILTFASQLRIA